MARKSPLSDKQWSEIEKRYLRGEKARRLADEFGIAESAIRKRYGAQNKVIISVVNQVVTANQNFKALSISAQISAQTLIEEYQSISTNLASAAKHNSITSTKLAIIASRHVDKVNHKDIEGSMETLREVAALTELSNKAAQTGLNLINANKERMAEVTANQGKQISTITRRVVDPEYKQCQN